MKTIIYYLLKVSAKRLTTSEERKAYEQATKNAYRKGLISNRQYFNLIVEGI